MNRQHTLSSTFCFNSDDLSANQRGRFSDTQREVVVMLGRINRAQQRAAQAATRFLDTTQSLPQILMVTGHVHTLSATQYVRSNGTSDGVFIETFYLVVHGEKQDVDLPITQDAMRVFAPNRNYTVYYYLNRGVPTLLSIYEAE